MTSSSSSPSPVYFATGQHHILCQIPSLDNSDYPSEYTDRWDLDHVRLPCSPRKYPSEVSFWTEIVQGLTGTIHTVEDLSHMMHGWNPKQNVWNVHALDAFLNHPSKSTLTSGGLFASNFGITNPASPSSSSSEYSSIKVETLARTELSSEDEFDQDQDQDQEMKECNEMLSSSEKTASNDSPRSTPHWAKDRTDENLDQFMTPSERDWFFRDLLPRIQELALRLPELVKKPIPLLKQQVDAAVTLSQEQIACLLANAFFNTFPSRNVPNKAPYRKSGFRKSRAHLQKGRQQEYQKAEEGNTQHDQKDAKPRGSKKPTTWTGTGSSGNRLGGDRDKGDEKSSIPMNQRTLFSYFEKTRPVPKDEDIGLGQGNSSASEPIDIDQDEEMTPLPTYEAMDAEETVEEQKNKKDDGWHKDRQGIFPSINFTSLFWSPEDKNPCTSSNAAKLRCILHYFDRVTTNMPTGVVTYHRQVLHTPISLKKDIRLSSEPFKYPAVTVDVDGPLEDAPPGALQLDFANKNIGGGVLGRGAVQEEIRFAICPELIISRLFIEQLRPNEAVLIKGAEQFSNYNGYSKTFEWHSSHIDQTPRDLLGRRKTEICAIDATPFKSRASKLAQFEEEHVLREIQKAVVGYRASPITCSEWGTCKPEPASATTSLAYPPIATGNWGCGAFGGHLHLKFLIQLIAAGICGRFSVQDRVPSREFLYFTYGLEAFGNEIRQFVSEALIEKAGSQVVDPEDLIEMVLQYPRRHAHTNDITQLREKSLFAYLTSALEHHAN